MTPEPIDYPRGETIIRRVSRGSYQIRYADGSLAVSFVPTMKQAELESAHINAQMQRAAEVIA